MAAKKIGWLLLELTLLAFFVWFPSPWALALTIAPAALCLIALPGNLVLRGRLEARLLCPETLQKGNCAELTLEIKNPTRLPAPRLLCTVVGENCLNGQTCRWKTVAALPPGGTWGERIALRSSYAGTLRLRLESVRLYDWFGLIGLRCSCTAAGRTVIQPDTFPMEVLCGAAMDSSMDSQQYAEDRPGADLTEIWQLREYVPGDSLRQVHWKLSEKYDRLIVREPALPIEQDVLVFWERSCGDISPRELDAQTETVAAMCRALTDGAVHFRLGWNDPVENRCILLDIPDMDTLLAALPRLLGTPCGGVEPTGAELLLQSRQDALCGHMVYCARRAQGAALELRNFGRTTYLLSGQEMQGAIRFTPENYWQVLSRLEI